MPPASNDYAFLSVSVAPRLGAGGLTVDGSPEQHATWQPSHWRPGGYDTSVDLAAVSVAYHTATFAALLHFLDAWEACKLAPWGWRTPRPPQSARHPASSGSSSGNGGRAAVPPLPDCPEPVAEMVLQSFSAHGTPVLGMLCLEGGSLELRCPGIAVQLPYNHHAQFDIVRMRDGGVSAGGTAADKPAASAGFGVLHRRSSCMPAAPLSDPAVAADPTAAVGEAAAEGELAPPLRYALTLVVQDIRLTVSGEDASGCLQVRWHWQPG